GLGVIIGVLTAKHAEARRRIEEVSETLDEQTGALTQNTRAWVAHQLEQDGVLERAEQLGINLETLTGAVLGNSQDIADLNEVLDRSRMTLIDVERAAEDYRLQLIEQGVDANEAAMKAVVYRSELEAQARAARDTGGAVD